MKSRILIGLSLMLCCFFVCGIYILLSIASLTSQLEQVATFHQVESMRESLENRIRTVQSDLLLQNLAQPVQFNRFVNDAEAVSTAVSECRLCHHNESTSRYLEQLAKLTDLYLRNISRTLTMRANPTRLKQVQHEAYRQGESLLDLVTQTTSLSVMGAGERATLVKASIEKTQRIITSLIIVGPLAVILLAWFFMHRFSGAITVLTQGVKEYEKGNLDYRIKDPLKDEFLFLAGGLNTMAATLSREKQYKQSVQHLYQVLFDSAQDAICIIETSPEQFGRILAVNAATAKLYGYNIEELQMMNCSQLSPDPNFSNFHEKVTQVIKGTWSRGTVTRQRRDGSCFPAEISASPMHIDGHTYVLTFTRDISEREQAKKELLHANQMAVAGQMAVGLAHEIKNPLAGIKATVEVLSADLDLEPEDRELFDRIVSEVDRLERLLRNLLKFARPPQPQLEIANLNRLLDYTIKNVEVTTAKSAAGAIHFRREFDDAQPQIEIDSAQLQQVFLNLYLNATEAFQGPGQITTRTRLLEDQSKVYIEIEDNGPGIPAATLDNIFNPFFTTKSKGTGLGLSICRRLIEQHKGTIDATSTPGKGTLFVIILPTSQENVQPAEGEYDG